MDMTIEQMLEYFGVEPLPEPDPDDPRTEQERMMDEDAQDLSDTLNSVRP